MLLKNHKLIQNAHRWQIQTIYVTSIFYLLFTLSGCALWNAESKPRPIKQVEVVTKEVQKTPLNLPHPPPVEMETIEWRIITPHNADAFFQEQQNKGLDPVIFGMTEKNYKILSTNFAQTRGYIIEQRKVLQEYKNYYESDNKSTAK